MHSVDENLCMGIQLMMWGYFKKLVIAERIGFVYKIFEDLNSYKLGGFSLLFVSCVWIICFYCDFSGYMDIVTGFTEILGIKLDKNFDRPFFSRSVSEIWRRWHITLGTWLIDYIYIPLGGSRKGKLRKNINTFIVFFSGLWHANGIDFIIWGCFFGITIVFTDILDPIFVRIKRWLHINTESVDWHIFQTIRTFLIFTFVNAFAVLIGSRNIKTFLRIIIKDFGFGRMDINSFVSYGLTRSDFIILVLSILILWFVEIKQANGSVRIFVAKLNMPAKCLLYALGLIVILFFCIYGAGYTTKGFAYAFY